MEKTIYNIFCIVILKDYNTDLITDKLFDNEDDANLFILDFKNNVNLKVLSICEWKTNLKDESFC